jgi:hypothetical protein
VSVLAAILALLLLALVVLVVAGPIRAARERAAASAPDAGRASGGPQRTAGSAPAPGGSRAELDELETAREAKYREIRDAELDYRTGKLSHADYEAIDADLRHEAIEILDRIERLQGPVREGMPGAVPDDSFAGCGREPRTDARERDRGDGDK